MFADYPVMAYVLDNNIHHPITEVVSGTAIGADSLGETWALQHNIPIKRFPAKWKRYGKSAGPIRNKQMAKYANALVLFWDGKSRGSANMLKIAHELELQVHEIHIVIT